MLDIVDKLLNVAPDLLWFLGVPAWERKQVDPLGSSEVSRIEGLTAIPGAVLPGPIEPQSFEGLAAEKGLGTMDAGPVQNPLGQPLFDPVGEDVAEPVDLDCLLLGEDNGAVAAAPDLFFPVVQTPDFAGDFGVDVAHEATELLGILWTGEQVVVIGEEAETIEAQVIEALGSAEGADDDLVELLTRAQEEPTVDGAAGDLDEVVFGYEAQRTSHH